MKWVSIDSSPVNAIHKASSNLRRDHDWKRLEKNRSVLAARMREPNWPANTVGKRELNAYSVCLRPAVYRDSVSSWLLTGSPCIFLPRQVRHCLDMQRSPIKLARKLLQVPYDSMSNFSIFFNFPSVYFLCKHAPEMNEFLTVNCTL